MAQLDRFFYVLYERGARELKLVSGEPPRLLFDEGPRPASSARPSAEQVLGLLAEILGPERIAEFRSRSVIGARLERPGLKIPLALAGRIDGDRVELVFRPLAVGESAPAPAPGPEPAAAAAPAPTPAPAAPAPAPAPPAAPAPTVTLSGPAAALDALFVRMHEMGASDLHLSCGEKPMVRVDGSLRRLDDQPGLTEQSLVELLRPATPDDNWAEFERCHDTDFAYEVPGLARFRGNLFRDRKGPGAVFRIIPSKILTAEQLGLSDKVLELCQLTKGLVLVTGPTGSGKSTTLTAMIDWINKNRDEHVITIEDPIEFVHDNVRCLINQREVGRHTEGFKRALRAALREDPDIVLVGEMRDLETIAIAIETAETGHLVFGTLHTTTAVSTVDRIIDQFPEGQQAQVRTMLSESLKGVIAQTLCRKIGGGRVAALEVLIGIPSVANLIREGKTFQIPSIMQTGRKYGMVTLNDALLQLVKKKLVEPEEAWRRAVDKIGMINMMRGAGIDVSFVPGDREAAAVG